MAQINSNAENMMVLMFLYIRGTTFQDATTWHREVEQPAVVLPLDPSRGTKVQGAEGAEKWNNRRLFSPYDPSF
jgi:hypothetical protein